MGQSSTTSLFGGDRPWSSQDWTSSDDRVRGGSSQSYLTIDSKSQTARFHGNLDITTLGGAGFASQRTTGEDRVWDLAAYSGVRLDISAADDKQYTLILKDQLLPKSPNGREQSTVSWEYDFRAKKDGEVLIVPWESFQPTYRGKEKKDAKPINLTSIKRISIMSRSFFGTQEGPFDITIRSISATNHKEKDDISRTQEISSEKTAHNDSHTTTSEEKSTGWMGRLLGSCVVS